MADADVFAVRFRDAVSFNGAESSTLYREMNRCVLIRVPGGVRVQPNGPGRVVFVPDANIKWLQFCDEAGVKRG